MLLKKLVQPFVEQRPYCVLVRAALERMLSPSRLNQVFRDHAVEQYEKDLLFSSLVEVMAQVVTRIEPSVLASYRALKEKLGQVQLLTPPSVQTPFVEVAATVKCRVALSNPPVCPEIE